MAIIRDDAFGVEVDMTNNEAFERSISAAADEAISMFPDPRMALNNTMGVQHKALHDLFGAISTIAKAQENVEIPILPLTKDFIDGFHHAIATTALVAALMSKGVLGIDGHRKPSDLN